MARYGTFDISPWARRLIPDTDRTAIRHRVPDGYTLWVSAKMPSTLIVTLSHRSTGLVAKVSGPYPQAIDDALAVLA